MKKYLTFGILFLALRYSVALAQPELNAEFSFAANNLEVTFIDETAEDIVFWLWDFGDGNTSTLQNPVHTYVSNGIYGVCLTVTSVSDQTDSTCYAVRLLPPPGFSKSFNPAIISIDQTSTLTFTIDNSGNNTFKGELSFADNLPAGLVISNTPNIQNSCTNGVLTANAGENTISYSGGSVPAFTTCQISVEVVATSTGVLVNTSDDLTFNAGNSGPATATLEVITAIPTIEDWGLIILLLFICIIAVRFMVERRFGHSPHSQGLEDN